MVSVGEELAQRPLKTDVISAIAQQELSVEACATREGLERLENSVANCAQAAALAALEESVRLQHEQLTKTGASLAQVQGASATKMALSQQAKEIDGLRVRLEDKVGRDECAGLLASKLDKAEARSIQQQQEQLQGAVVSAEAAARRVQDAMSNTSNAALDSLSNFKQLSSRMDRLSMQSQEMDARLGARRAELQSLTKVVRLVLDDAEMRCAIDEAEGATAAEATDVLARLRGVGGGRVAGAPMTVTGVTLHRPAGGALQPMPPGAAAADKVWYKQTLQPRGEVLGARRRMLVNARHSWVGDSCLARPEHEPTTGDGTKRDMGGGVGAQLPAECMLTPSSTEPSPRRHQEL